MSLFESLKEIHRRPEPFERYMAADLWTDDHISEKMLAFHVDEKRTRTIYNWLQYFSPESLQDEFEKAGFTEYELFGNVAGAPFDVAGPEFAIVGRKRPLRDKAEEENRV